MPKAAVAKTTEPKTKKPAAPKATGLNVPVYSLAGKEAGTLELPEEMFGAPVNQQILKQALRVYMTNKKGHHGNTKTRGEVTGSTRKIGNQKGSGNARHGSIKAPIFIGGGIALGPRTRTVRLELPKKMKKAALISAFSAKAAEGSIMAVDGLDKAAGKTKEMVAFLKAVNKKSALFITATKKDEVVRSVRNIQGSDVTFASQVNALDIISHQTVFISKDAVSRLGKVEEAQ